MSSFLLPPRPRAFRSLYHQRFIEPAALPATGPPRCDGEARRRRGAAFDGSGTGGGSSSSGSGGASGSGSGNGGGGNGYGGSCGVPILALIVSLRFRLRDVRGSRAARFLGSKLRRFQPRE